MANGPLLTAWEGLTLRTRFTRSVFAGRWGWVSLLGLYDLVAGQLLPDALHLPTIANLVSLVVPGWTWLTTVAVTLAALLLLALAGAYTMLEREKTDAAGRIDALRRERDRVRQEFDDYRNAPAQRVELAKRELRRLVERGSRIGRSNVLPNLVMSDAAAPVLQARSWRDEAIASLGKLVGDAAARGFVEGAPDPRYTRPVEREWEMWQAALPRYQDYLTRLADNLTADQLRDDTELIVKALGG